MKFLTLSLVLFAISVSVYGSDCQSTDHSIQGVWEVIEIATDYDSAPDIGPETSRVHPNKNPLPSQIMFTNRHYSMIWSAGKEAMRAFSVRWQPTDAEKIQRFGEVGMNTGTYVLEDGLLKVRPRVARVPEFMGGSMTYACEWNGENLILTLMDEYTFDGVRAPWADDAGGSIHLILARRSD